MTARPVAPVTGGYVWLVLTIGAMVVCGLPRKPVPAGVAMPLEDE